MRKFTYINTKTGERIYSENRLDLTDATRKDYKLVQEIRGSVPRSVEKRKEVSDEHDLALYGPKV